MGDITPTGQQSQYDDVKRVLNKNKHPENVWSTVGNHEFYAGKWTADGKTLPKYMAKWCK